MIFTFFVFIVAFYSFSYEANEDFFSRQRENMVDFQLKNRGINDPRVLTAMRKVPRHEFVPKRYRHLAYADSPLPIGENQTISQPYIVAVMTELLELKGKEKVLEIGTGSGYQAAVLAQLAMEVYTIEIIPELASRSKAVLNKLGYKNIKVRAADGYFGWIESAPFDAVIITAAPEKLPQPLVDQVKEGGRIVVPVGNYYQQLKVYIKKDGKVTQSDVLPVRFVPMTGYIEHK